MIDGKYKVQRCIGRGGMGCVFLADQPALARQVVIKVLHPELAESPVHAQQIRDEAVAACRVRSQHCVTVIDCGTLADGTSYLVMGHVPGRSLGRMIAEEIIPLERAIALFDQILSALGSVHASGLVHADVKSENFLVESIANTDRVTLIDFGLARVPGSPLCSDVEDGMVMVSGTPEYMAPEVVCGEPPMPASDLYAAGVILYELLTGVTPFAGGTAVEIMVRQAHNRVVPPSLCRPDLGIPPAIDAVVLRALAKRPEARFPDAATFARELHAAMRAPRPSQGTRERRTDRSCGASPTRTCVPRPRQWIARSDTRPTCAPRQATHVVALASVPLAS